VSEAVGWRLRRCDQLGAERNRRPMSVKSHVDAFGQPFDPHRLSLDFDDKIVTSVSESHE
jgi:hypothetical protein